MAMPRPSGRALKIAKEVVPGLRKHEKAKRAKRKRIPNDEVEMKIVSINEMGASKLNRG